MYRPYLLFLLSRGILWIFLYGWIWLSFFYHRLSRKAQLSLLRRWGWPTTWIRTSTPSSERLQVTILVAHLFFTTSTPPCSGWPASPGWPTSPTAKTKDWSGYAFFFFTGFLYPSIINVLYKSRWDRESKIFDLPTSRQDYLFTFLPQQKAPWLRFWPDWV